jgi:hypothetical protein
MEAFGGTMCVHTKQSNDVPHTSAAGDAEDGVEEVVRRLVPASSKAPKCPSFLADVTVLISVGHPDDPPLSKSVSPKTASRY